nr:hypothetical protein [Tanacetum cinerariifolium]
FDANMRFLFKSREEIEVKDEEIIKSINETPAQKAAKRRELSEEAQEAEDLRKRLEIVQDEDDDVFVEATPLAQKVMFEEPDGQDAIWRNQKSVYGLALVKRWKLLTSCGVHVITLSTVQLFLLVERSESKDCQSNIDAASLRLKLFKDVNPVAGAKQEQEARENVALVYEHLASVEIEKMVKGQENVVDDSLIPKNDEHNIPNTRLVPRSDKESPEVEVTNIVIRVNVYDKEEEEDKITDEVYELKRREIGKIIKESRNTPFPTPIRSPRIHADLVYLDTEKLQELMVTTPSSSSPNTNFSNTNRLLSLFKAKPALFKSYKSFFQELHRRYGYLFKLLRARFMPRKSFVTIADHLHEAISDSLPTMVDKHVKEQVQQQVPKQV